MPAHRATALHDRHDAGFTLIEMLVALAIFAMVSAAGVMLLRASITTQASVSSRLGADGGLNRLRAMIGRELATAQARPSRDQQGSLRPAFSGTPAAFAFVHASAGDDTGAALARVSYAIEAGALIRRSTAALDGAADGEPATILRNVTSLTCRYRGVDGSWSDNWTADDAARLPRVVELTVQRSNGAPLTMRFLVAPDGLAPEGQAGGLT